MSIASEITRLQNAKATLKTKLNAKNDNEHQIDDETLDEFGDFVDSIQTGGGGSVEGVINTIVANQSVSSYYTGGRGTTSTVRLNRGTSSSPIYGEIPFSLISPVKGFVFGFARSNYTLSNNLTLLAETDWFVTDGLTQKLFVAWCDDLTQTCTLTQETDARMELWCIMAKDIETPTSNNVILNTTTSLSTYTVNPTKKPCLYFFSSVYNLTNPANVLQLDVKFGNIWLSGESRLVFYGSYNDTPKTIFSPSACGIIGIELNQ